MNQKVIKVLYKKTLKNNNNYFLKFISPDNIIMFGIVPKIQMAVIGWNIWPCNYSTYIKQNGVFLGSQVQLALSPSFSIVLWQSG